MLATQGVGQVLVTVEDVDRAVAFYQDVLGVPLLFRVPGRSMAFLDGGSFRLYIDQETPEYPASRPVLYFTVDDVHAAHDSLVSAGVRPADPPSGEPHVVNRTETSELWMSFFHDPEGTLFAVMAEIRS